MSSHSLSNVRNRDFFAWCLSFCFAGLAMTAAAQSQTPGQNPNASGTVAIPPDVQAQPAPQVAAPPQPSLDLWDRWGIQKASDDDDWTRHFRIGAMVALNISANFNLKSSLNFNRKPGVYDDGYVIRDPANTQDDYTSNWGYNNASQVSGSSLIMHQAKSFAPNSGGLGTKEDGSGFAGFDMAYGGNILDWGQAKIGWDLGFGLLPIDIQNKQSVDGTVIRNVYSFDTGGINLLGEPPGYQGSPNGGANIHSTPTQLADDSVPGNIAGSQTLDVILYTLRLGPSVYWNLNEDIGLSVGAGPAVGIVSGNLQYNETITTATTATTSKGQVDGTDVVYGGYVNASLMYHLVENGDLYVGVQYMSLGDATISGGGRSGQLNLGGQVYISAGINWPF